MKPSGGEGQNGRLKCRLGFLVLLGLSGYRMIITDQLGVLSIIRYPARPRRIVFVIYLFIYLLVYLFIFTVQVTLSDFPYTNQL